MSDETQTGALPDAAQPEQSGAVPAGAVQPELFDKGDFEARLANEPGFAASEFKKAQAELSRLQNRMAPLAPIEPWAQALGGADGILQGAKDYGAMQNDPRMRAIIETWKQTGDVPRVGATDPQPDTDLYLDPTERKVRELEARLAQKEQQDLRQETMRAKSTFKEQLSASLGPQSHFSDAEKQRVLAGVDAQFSQWENTPDGQRAIVNVMSDPNRAQDMIDMVTGNVLAKELRDPSWLEAIAERAQQRKQQQKASAATAAAGVPVEPNGRLAPPTLRGAPREVGRQAMREFLRENGLTSLPDR